MSRKYGTSNLLLLVLIVLVGILLFNIRQLGGKGGDEETVDKAIDKYIQAHPEKILASLQTMQRKQAGAQVQDAKKSIIASKEQLLNDKNSAVIGNPDGDVTIVEFFDYSCHFCKQVFPDLKKLIESDKGVKVIMKEFPILGPDSENAAKAAIAVFKLDPEKYFAYHSALMEFPGQKSEQVLLDQAKKLGLKPAKVKEEMGNPEIAQIIAANRALGNVIGIRGTPGFIFGDELVPGAIPYDQMKQKVEDLRKKNGGGGEQKPAGEKPAEEDKDNQPAQ